MALSMAPSETTVKALVIHEMTEAELVDAVRVMRDQQAAARSVLDTLMRLHEAHSLRAITGLLRDASGRRGPDAGQFADDKLRDIADQMDGWDALSLALQRHGDLGDDLLADVDMLLLRERQDERTSAMRYELRVHGLASKILEVERRRQSLVAQGVL